ncbi:hypothetical protein [Streptomyces sp. PU_AKi4]|uniref:hypothetical protein n=1 Tax=Streptomyces sp. PU_AKi4 TaxID=2800809 RepID=UPI0035268C71
MSPRTDDTQCLVRGTASQHIDHTASRRSGPRKWLKAVQWLIGAGLHPKANTTTLRVAEDLAARMDYDTGHVLYGLDEMIARLDSSRTTITNHIKYLRELGALAWVQHGTRTNRLRSLGRKGYQGTATVYAAVIPAAYDHAMGHTIVGTGYTARIVIDQRGQTPTTTPSEPVDNPPVENPVSEALGTPSLTWLRREGKVQVVGGSNYTSQARPPKTRVPHQSSQINGRPRTAADVQKAGKTARLVRAMVNWTQSVPLRRLEYVLRPWTDRGQDAYQIAADLNGMCSGMRWKPARPDAFIQARLTADAERQQQIQAEQAAAARWEQENPVQGAFVASRRQQHDVMAALREGMARYQQTARANGWDDLSHGENANWDAEADIAAFLGSNA